MNIKTQSPSGNESIVLIHWICKETFKYLLPWFNISLFNISTIIIEPC